MKSINQALKGFQDNPELKFSGTTSRGVLGQKVRNLCRDMTQPLGNSIKSKKSGVPFTDYDETGIEQLFKEMAKVSNPFGNRT